MKKGIQLISETTGDGPVVEKGQRIKLVYTLSLNKGEIVQKDVEFEMILGDRNIIAGLYYGIEGIRVGGTRKFRVSPHLAYRDKGVDKVPPNAVLVFDVRVLGIIQGGL